MFLTKHLDTGVTLSILTLYIVEKFDVSLETLLELFLVSSLVGDPV